MGNVTKSGRPRLLIADDDAVSLQFLTDVCTQLGCDVIGVNCGHDTLSAAGSNDFDLLLLDRRMPDIGGEQLLHALRVREIVIPAIVTSADLGPATIASLRNAGFAGHLEKPASVAQIADLLREQLRPDMQAQTQVATMATCATESAVAILDDDEALLAIGGNIQALRALRELLIDEVEVLIADLSPAGNAPENLQLPDRLHKLRAACGFCGATALATAAASFEIALRQTSIDVAHRKYFLEACEITLQALAKTISQDVAR